MSRMMRFICLGAGVVLFALGVQEVIQEGEWVLAILSALIIAFSALAIQKSRSSASKE